MNEQPTPPEAPAGAPQTVHPPAPPRKNSVGRVALVVAIAGFVFACIPGALIVGWVLLPAAFVLGIVGVTRTGQRKGTSIAAIITSVVGTVVGVVVFLAVAVDAVDQAFDEAAGGEIAVVTDDASAEPSMEPDAGADESTEEVTEEPVEVSGTRDDPFAFTDVFSNDDWQIVLTGFDADANAEVAAANEFNDEPEAGHHWVTLELAATYVGEDSGVVMEVGVDYVTADGTVIGSHDGFVSGLDPEFDSLAELYTGAAEDGKVAFMAPDGIDALIRITPGFFADEVFFSLPAE